MRKLSIFVLALFAVMAMGVVAANAAKNDKVKVASTVSIKFQGDSGPYAEGGTFSGKVKAKKGCKKERVVKVKKVGGGNVGQDVTDNQGNYSVDAGNVSSGSYFAKAKKRTIEKKNGKIIVCQKAKSKTITAP